MAKINKRKNINKFTLGKNKKIIQTLEKEIVYSVEDYGFKNGNKKSNIEFLIIDSGFPEHSEFDLKGECKNFCENQKKTKDENGHSTIITGILASNKKIKGIYPEAIFNYAKVMNKENIDYNSVVASILWGIVKKIDIIVIALSSPYDYSVLHDAIIKAYNSNICIFAADDNSGDNNYPALYPEVFSVASNSTKNNESIDLILKNKKYVSTYLDNKYVNVSGSSVATAIVSGIAASIISSEKIKSPKDVYEKLKSIKEK